MLYAITLLNLLTSQPVYQSRYFPSSLQDPLFPAGLQSHLTLTLFLLNIRLGFCRQLCALINRISLLTTTNTLLHPHNGRFSTTTWVSRHQKGTASLDDIMQTICTSLQTDGNQHLIDQFLQAGCFSCRPNDSVKALKAILAYLLLYIYYTHPFNGPLSETTQVSRYQKSKSNLDSTEARDSEWQWNPLGHMQAYTSLQTDNHASTPPPVSYTHLTLPTILRV